MLGRIVEPGGGTIEGNGTLEEPSLIVDSRADTLFEVLLCILDEVGKPLIENDSNIEDGSPGTIEDKPVLSGPGLVDDG